MAERIFKVVIEKDEGGLYVADVPALEGCHTQARTKRELMRRIREVIELCLEDHEPKVKQVDIKSVKIPLAV